MKILILGYTQSIFILEYIRFVLNNPSVEITLFDNGSASSEYYDFYRSRGVQLIYVPKQTPILGKIPKIRALWYEYRLRRALKKQGPYDIIHLHFVSPEKFRYVRNLIKSETCLIASFWGSDIYRQTLKTLLKLKKHLDSCTFITLSTKRMVRTFRDVFGNRYDQKIRSVFFGSSILEVIDETKKSLDKYKSKIQLDIDPNSLVVSIGYNRMTAQQHDKVLEALSKMPEHLLKKLTFVLPFTYGECTNDYETKVLSLLEKLPSANLVVRGFQPTEQIAVLRLATDIYINAQTTDAFSSSVQEYLYAGALLFNPVWLKYDEFDDWGICYIEYQNFADLPGLLQKTIENSLPDFQGNAKILKNNISWKSVRQAWLDIYREVFNKRK